jgi:iron complex outermembrane receptor protein
VQTSAFYIDWTAPQLFQTFPGCPAQFTTNAGHAVSKGADLQVQAKPFSALTLTASAGYNDAHYTQTVLGPTPVPGAVQAIVVNKGDTLPVAPWSVNLGAQYDFSLTSAWGAYVRADYQYASSYKRTTGPGSVSYAPDQYVAPETRFVSARLGATKGPVEVALFVDNLLDSYDTLALTSGGRGTCKNTACTSFSINEPQYIGTTFRPRTVGMQLAYRY